MMMHTQILAESLKILKERGQAYGGIENNFDRISKIASAMLGRYFSPRDVAIVLAATKFGRMLENPFYKDNYVDAINYVAFMAELTNAGEAKVENPRSEWAEPKISPII